MRNKICAVTGASQGIGRAMAHGLAAQGAEVVLVGRDEGRTGAVAQAIARETGNDRTRFMIADLADFTSIRGLGAAIRSRYGHIDVLMNNAGGMKRRRIVTPDGFEYSWKLNHLGYFLLTAELLPLLQAAEAGRIVNTASSAHLKGRIDFDDLQSVRGYEMWRAYGQSKLANIMFTYALARRLESGKVTANCFHPGVVRSGFVANIGPLEKLFAPLVTLFFIPPEAGAQTGVYLAGSPEAAGANGEYFIKCKPARSSSASYDEATQERLWRVSLEQTGAVYPF